MCAPIVLSDNRPLDLSPAPQTSEELLNYAFDFADQVLTIDFQYLRYDSAIDLDMLRETMHVCQCLQSINFTNLNVDDSKIERICEILKDYNIKSITINYNHSITNLCLSYLSNVSSLDVVDLQKCTRIFSSKDEAISFVLVTGGWLGYE